MDDWLQTPKNKVTKNAPAKGSKTKTVAIMEIKNAGSLKISFAYVL